GGDETTEEKEKWGIRHRSRKAQDIVHQISLLLALTGQSVIAFDQIDTAVQQSAVEEDLAKVAGSEADVRAAAVNAGIAHGLSDLRDRTRRTLIVVATLATTWQQIEQRAPASFAPRFRRRVVLQGIRHPRIDRELIEKRFAPRFEAVHFR